VNELELKVFVCLIEAIEDAVALQRFEHLNL